MIRIKPNACGFTGYKCTGDTYKLREPFLGRITYDPLRSRRFPVGSPEAEELMYNYLNMPIKFRGFQVSGVPIIPVTVTASEAVEVSCAALSDSPSLISGWMFDIYDKRAASVQAGYSVASGSLVYKDMYGTESLYFKAIDAPAPNEFIPGLLEPMISVQFDPAQVDVTPTIDYTLDGIADLFKSLSEWRDSVNAMLSAMSTGSGAAAQSSSMLAARAAKESASGCTGGLQVKLKGDDVADLYDTDRDPKPKFKVVQGGKKPAVIINGKRISKVASTFSSYPHQHKWGDSESEDGIDLFLQIPYRLKMNSNWAVFYIKSGDLEIDDYKDSDMVDSANGEYYMYVKVGGVRRTRTSADLEDPSVSYVVNYSIEPTECMLSVTFDRVPVEAACSGITSPDMPNGAFQIIPTMWSAANDKGIIDWKDFIDDGDDVIPSTMCIQFSN